MHLVNLHETFEIEFAFNISVRTAINKETFDKIYTVIPTSLITHACNIAKITGILKRKHY